MNGCLNRRDKAAFSNFTALERVFEKVRFRDGLV